jgi:phosphoglycolate phosphatase
VPKRFDLVVFDWDGTLLDSAGAIAACIQCAARDLGLPVPDETRARHVIGLGLQDALAHAVPELHPRDYGRLVDRYKHHFLLRDADLLLFDGVRQTLADLHGRGHLLAVATGKSAAGLRRALVTAQLEALFADTRCADQTAPKPDPAMLHELMEALDVPPERTLMIGDTTHDLQMAAAAGVQAIGVTYGAHPRHALESAPRLALVHSTTELHEWLMVNA